MAKELKEIDFEFERSITSDKVAWYDINKLLKQLDQNDPKITKLKGMLKYIDKCDVYLKLWDRKKSHDQANLQQQINKRDSERLATKSEEEPPVKIKRKDPKPTPVETSITKSPVTVEEIAKIVDVAVWKRKWPFIFVRIPGNSIGPQCYELKNAILLSPASLVPCFIRQCSGGLHLKLRGPLLEKPSVRRMCNLLIQDYEFIENYDKCQFAVTECRTHNCGIYFSSKLISEIKNSKKTIKELNRTRGRIATKLPESDSYLHYVFEKTVKEKRPSEKADIIDEWLLEEKNCTFLNFKKSINKSEK